MKKTKLGHYLRVFVMPWMGRKVGGDYILTPDSTLYYNFEHKWDIMIPGWGFGLVVSLGDIRGCGCKDFVSTMNAMYFNEEVENEKT